MCYYNFSLTNLITVLQGDPGPPGSPGPMVRLLISTLSRLINCTIKVSDLRNCMRV